MSKYYINPNGTLPLNPGGDNGPVLMNEGQVRSRCNCCYCPCYDFFNGERYGDFRKNVTGFPCCGLVEEYSLTQTVPYQASRTNIKTRIANHVTLTKMDVINISGFSQYACGWGATNIPIEYSNDDGGTWDLLRQSFQIYLVGPTTDPTGIFQWVGIEGRCIWELIYGFGQPFNSLAASHYKFYSQNDLPTGIYNVAPYFYAGQFQIS